MRERIEKLQQKLAGAEDGQEKVKLLNELAWAVGPEDPQRALALSQQAFQLATSDAAAASPAAAVDSLINLGRFSYQMSRLDRAQLCLLTALDRVPELDEAARQALEPKVRLGLGNVCWRLGDYAQALEHYLQALSLYQALDNPQGQSSVLSNLGMVYGVLGEYERALEVYRQVLSIHEAHEESGGHGLALNNMAMVYLEAEDYEQALEHACRALEMGRGLNHRGLEAHALDTVGAAYLGLEQPQQALDHFRDCLRLARELGNRHDELAALSHMGQALVQQGKSSKAEEVLQMALGLAQELDDQVYVRDCHRELARLYREAGDFERALTYYEQFHEAERTIYNERADMRYKTLQVRHETETARQQAEIMQLRNVELEREIEERREAERALRRSEARFRQLLEELPIAVHVYEPDGTLSHVNRAWCEMWNVAGERVVGRFNLLRSPLLDRLDAREPAERAFAGDVLDLVELAIDGDDLGNDAGQRWLRSHAYPLFYEDGQLRHVVILTEDVTEQRAAQEALRRAQKIESLGALAGGVAHDFNNLLVAILGQTSLAAARLPDDDPALVHVQKATSAAEQAADLTNQMLAYSGRGHFSLQRVDLNELIEKNARLCRAAVPRTVQLDFQLAPDLPPVEVDPAQVQQLLLNLVRNGAESYDEDGGPVVVRTALKELGEGQSRYSQYTGVPLAPGAYVQLVVSDEGAGIAQEALPHVFDPFYSRREDGRGLGLAAVLGIMRGHRGGLDVRSEEGRGTTVEILWPAQQEVTAVSNGQQQPEQGGSVLVIDDEELVRDAVADILTLENIEVIAAEDGYSGLDAYRQHKGEIGLVLLDLSMPGINGEETFRRLRQIDPHVRVLLSSGYSAEDVGQRFDEEEPVGFLQKPYSVGALLEVVKDHL